MQFALCQRGPPGPSLTFVRALGVSLSCSVLLFHSHFYPRLPSTAQTLSLPTAPPTLAHLWLCPTMGLIPPQGFFSDLAASTTGSRGSSKSENLVGSVHHLTLGRVTGCWPFYGRVAWVRCSSAPSPVSHGSSHMVENMSQGVGGRDVEGPVGESIFLAATTFKSCRQSKTRPARWAGSELGFATHSSISS